MLLSLIAALAAAPGGAPARPVPLGWLAGRWCTAEVKGVRTFESWSATSEAGMEGQGATFRAGRRVESERMSIRIESGRAVYRASPGGSPPVSFREVARGRASITFENRRHDYPQRIRYRREGPALIATISLSDGGRAMRWRYRPCSEPVPAAAGTAPRPAGRDAPARVQLSSMSRTLAPSAW